MSTFLASRMVAGVVSNVLKTMANADISPAEENIKDLSVAVIVGISNANLKLVLILQMSQTLARRLASAMLMEPDMPWGSTVEDAVAELGNITAGNIKPHVTAGLSLALPTVISGSSFSISIPPLSDRQIENFTCLGEPLRVVLGRAA